MRLFRRRKTEKENGSLTLETAIILPIFMFIFMFVYSLFGVVSTQHQMSHALIQATKSLSLDSYYFESMDTKEVFGKTAYKSLTSVLFRQLAASSDGTFTPKSKWYSSTGDTADSTAKSRFVAYLAGGDEDTADEMLENMGVRDGLDGISFEVGIDDDNLTVTIKYEIEYVFDFFTDNTLEVEQTMKATLWGVED